MPPIHLLPLASPAGQVLSAEGGSAVVSGVSPVGPDPERRIHTQWMEPYWNRGGRGTKNSTVETEELQPAVWCGLGSCRAT